MDLFSFNKKKKKEETPPPQPKGPKVNNQKHYSVTELNELVLKTIETKFTGGIWLEAEIRDFKNHSSGHWYYSLVDDSSMVAGVMWRFNASKQTFTPRDGQKVLLHGRPTMYTKRGSYQFAADKILPVGIGTRALALRDLKEKLQQEGLFDERHKKPLPRYPSRIGVVTSQTGAAFRDIMNVLSRRAPYVEIILRPAMVQGDTAGADIARGVDSMNRYGRVEVMIVGRGGGSEDDLWCFNDEGLARSIYRSSIPVISAVGHEIDNPVSDLVADKRAPTPSAGAELAVADKLELLTAIRELDARLFKGMRRHIERKRERLSRMTSRSLPQMLRRGIEQRYQSIDLALARAKRSMDSRMRMTTLRLESLGKRLHSASPYGILEKGYSIVTTKDGEVVRSHAQIDKGELLDIRFGEGGAKVTVESTTV